MGHFYLVPYNDTKKGCKVAQFQMGWKGFYQLALRSGYYKKIVCLPIKKGELISWNELEETIEVKLIEDEEEREKAETIGYYCYYEYLTGFRKAMYWNKKRMELHAKRYSQGYRNDIAKGTKYTYWSTDFDSMAMKTMLRQLISKYGIMSTELQEAYNKDMATIENDGSYEYVDNKNIEEDLPQIEKNEKDVKKVDIESL